MKQNAFILTAAAIVLLVFAGCSNTDTGIFYSLEQEKKITDSDQLDNNLAIGSIAVSSGYYFITAGASIKRSEAGTSPEWKNVELPTVKSGERTMAASLTVAGGRLWAAFYSIESLKFGLYYSDSLASVSWNAADLSSVNGFSTLRIDRLIPSADGTTLFIAGRVQRAGDTVYVLLAWNGTTLTFDEADEHPATPFLDADYDGSLYWFVTMDTIYSTSDFTAAPTPDGKVGDSEKFRAVVFVPASNAVFLSGRNGYVYRTDEGTTLWAAVNGDQVKKDGSAVDFTDFAYYAPEDILFVGTEGAGYYEIADAVSGSPTLGKPLFTEEGYTYSVLYSASVRSFGMDAANEVILVGTGGSGLWKNIDDDGRIWEQE